MRFVEHRIGDRRVPRPVRKWLKAGGVEDGARQSVRKALRKGLSSRRRWRTSVFITSTICGPGNGADAMHKER